MLAALFVAGNLIFTTDSASAWGPPFTATVLRLSLLIAVITGLRLLDTKLENLEYETFMLQKWIHRCLQPPE